MFEAFHARFRPTPAGQSPSSPPVSAAVADVVGYGELMRAAAGFTFEDGLYRLHSAASAGAFDQHLREAFPEHVGRLHPFGFDWLGRQFALDLHRVANGEPLVMMLEPGTGLCLEIPTDFVGFHDEELVEFGDASLACDFFDEWAAEHAAHLPMAHSACVGYRVPLFLGGTDGPENVELTDLDVYWSFAGQLISQTADLADGTPVGGITASEE